MFQVEIRQVNVKDGSSKICVKCPYSPDFTDFAKKFPGKVEFCDNLWHFNTRDEKSVREKLIALFGTDGEHFVPTVDIQVEYDHYRTGLHQAWEMFGRVIATRQGRDRPVRLGEGVVVIAGGFPDHGGSVANPRLDGEEGTIVEIRDVPESAADESMPGTKIVRRNSTPNANVTQHNALSSVTDQELIDEVRRRGYKVQTK